MTVHLPVLPNEVTEGLALSDGDIVIDGTFGGGGHTKLILAKIGNAGRVIGFDRDPEVIELAIEWAPEQLELVNANYADVPEYLAHLQIDSVDGIVLDLGLSSDQLADDARGFSFHSDGDLDLRFNPLAGEPAWRLINRLGEKHLANLIYEFGEEKFSRRIARKICQQRHQEPIRTARQLARLVRSCIPPVKKNRQSIDPATRTFQALRIGVNEELKWLKVAIHRLPKILKIGGRIAVISFHSLEDRIVKSGFLNDESLDVITKRPVTATENEIGDNPRSRSAKLRIAERKR